MTERGDVEALSGVIVKDLGLAAQHGVRSVAFPAISTGIYRFPRDRACRIAVTETRSFTARSTAIERVVFCCFDAETLTLYRRELGL